MPPARSRGSSGAQLAAERVPDPRSRARVHAICAEGAICGAVRTETVVRALTSARAWPSSMGRSRFAPRAAGTPGRRGVRVAPRALPRRRAGLRRHVPDPPRRRRPHLGGAPRGDRCEVRPSPRARSRRGDRHRRLDLAGAARGAMSRGSTRSPSAASTPRRPRPGARFEGLFRLPGGRAPLLRIATWTSRGADLDADRRRRRGAGRSAFTASAPTRRRSSRRWRRCAATARSTRSTSRDSAHRRSPPGPARRALVRRRRARLPRRMPIESRTPGRQLDGRPDRDRGRARGTPIGSRR